MNEEFEVITVTISLTATAKRNNFRAATGKLAFSAAMQSMSRHVIYAQRIRKGGKKFFHAVR